MRPRDAAIIALVIIGAYTLVSCSVGLGIAFIIFYH
jgi:hypothetical protein